MAQTKTSRGKGQVSDPKDTRSLSARVLAFARRQLLRVMAYAASALAILFIVLTTLYSFAPPISTLMIRDLALLRGYERDWISLDDTAPVLVHSIIASEDQTFCAHNGVEWLALREQFDRWWAGEDARGASTLSMQVARNLFLWQGRSAFRKALEVPVALWLDWALSKRRMMELYINVAELGPQVYGFEAAAQRAYGRSANDLTRRQAGLLVATLPLPAERDAARPSGRHSSASDRVVTRARQMGAYIGCLAPQEGAV